MGDRTPVVTVIIPAFNERETIERALDRVLAAPFEKEVIVVDDASTDGTAELLAARRDIVLLRHARNQGKGCAIRTALARATGDVVVIQDADLEYDPAEIPALVAPILSGQTDVVYGSRFLTSGFPAGMRWPNRLINRLLAGMVRLFYRAPMTDEATCYKAFRTDLLQTIPLTCRRFEFCPEVTAKLLRRGHRIVELPISYHPRTQAEGKKIGWWDGVVAVWTLLKYRVLR